MEQSQRKPDDHQMKNNSKEVILLQREPSCPKFGRKLCANICKSFPSFISWLYVNFTLLSLSQYMDKARCLYLEMVAMKSWLLDDIILSFIVI